jgi:hypothetical protein
VCRAREENGDTGGFVAMNEKIKTARLFRADARALIGALAKRRVSLGGNYNCWNKSQLWLAGLLLDEVDAIRAQFKNGSGVDIFKITHRRDLRRNLKARRIELSKAEQLGLFD